MELITILSTIILVATISTFILSIGAYILYKIRNRRESRLLTEPAGKINAELVTVDEEENWEELKKRSGKVNLPRVQYDDEREIEEKKQRIVYNKERPKVVKTITSKYTKYNFENHSTRQNNSGSGDLQWR
jgi:hypothetical protein